MSNFSLFLHYHPLLVSKAYFCPCILVRSLHIDSLLHIHICPRVRSRIRVLPCVCMGIRVPPRVRMHVRPRVHMRVRASASALEIPRTEISPPQKFSFIIDRVFDVFEAVISWWMTWKRQRQKAFVIVEDLSVNYDRKLWKINMKLSIMVPNSYLFCLGE